MNPTPSLREKDQLKRSDSLLSKVAPKLTWGLAGLMVMLLAAVIVWRPTFAFSLGPKPGGATQALLTSPGNVTAGLPPLVELPQADYISAIIRKTNTHTNLLNSPRESAQDYTVVSGDSVYAIAKSFDLEPESVLWANYDVLNDNPDTISPGMTLKIPPVNGVLYKWKAGDSIANISAKYKVEPEAVLAWPGNNLDMANPEIQPDTLVMIPEGKGEFRTWLNFTIPRGRAGVNVTIYGPGACETGEGGAYGSGFFAWPTTGGHTISGNDYWDGHLGLDISAQQGDAILASDGGVVVYSGGIGGGYGNMVMIDHGGGFQTLYAHLSRVGIRCGASVGKGSIIGYAGSTGNSTGPHLHFEIRYFGAWVNPWSVLN